MVDDQAQALARLVRSAATLKTVPLARLDLEQIYVQEDRGPWVAFVPFSITNGPSFPLYLQLLAAAAAGRTTCRARVASAVGRQNALT